MTAPKMHRNALGILDEVNVFIRQWFCGAHDGFLCQSASITVFHLTQLKCVNSRTMPFFFHFHPKRIESVVENRGSENG